MPEIKQYSFNHKELVEILIKNVDVHEGKWMLVVSFNFTAGNFGPDANSLLPSGLMAVSGIGIQRVDENVPPELVVDAAVVNPGVDIEPPPPKAKGKSSG